MSKEASITINTIDATGCSLIKDKELHRIIAHIRAIEQENRDLKEKLHFIEDANEAVSERARKFKAECDEAHQAYVDSITVDGLGNNNV